MKFKISRDNLTFLLDRAVHTIPSKDVKEILKYFLFKLDEIEPGKGILRVLSFDLELGCLVSLTVDAEAFGSVGIPAGKMMEITSTLGKESIAEFNIENDVIKIKSGRASWTIHGKSSKQYPETPAFNDKNFFKVSRKTFVTAVSSVFKACAREDTKKGLVAVHLTQDFVLAADGHRAYRYRLGNGLAIPDTILIHYNAAKLLVDVLLGSEGDLLISQDNFYILFKSNDDVFYAIGVEDSPHAIQEKVFAPTEGYTHHMILPRKGLVEAVKRVAVCAESGTICMDLVKVSDTVGNLRLYARNVTDDSAEEEITSVKWEGGAFVDRRIYRDFLLEAVQNLGEENVVISMPDEDSKLRFRIDEGPFSAVIVPRGKNKASVEDKPEENKPSKPSKSKKPSKETPDEGDSEDPSE